MRNLVVGTAFHYEAARLRVFLASAARHLPDAEIVIFCDRDEPDHVDQLERFNPHVRVIVPADQRLRARLGLELGPVRALIRSNKLKWPVRWLPQGLALRWLGEHRAAFLHPAVARYLWTASLLESLDPKPGRVLLSDARDVLFQCDPFEDAPDTLICGEEPVTLKDCHVNSVWFEYVYSNRLLEEFGSARVLCSGVTLGTFDQVVAYANAMAAEIDAHFSTVLARAGLDQAIHNKLLHGDRILPFVASRNGEEWIATLHYSTLNEFQFDELDGLRTKNGRRVRIVHQYDRHAALTRWIDRQYP